MEGSADYWWEAKKNTMTPEELEAMTWAQFKEELYDQYVPKCYRKDKEVEFYNLTQGEMTVATYAKTFVELSRYAPELVDTDAKMAERFLAGLKLEIGTIMTGRARLTYRESLSQAMEIEAAFRRQRTATRTAPPHCASPRDSPPPQYREKRRWEGIPQHHDNKRHQPGRYAPNRGGEQATPNQRGDNRPRAPQCPICSKHHPGECRIKANRCFNCGGIGHFSKQCPSNKIWQGQNPQGPHQQGATRGGPNQPPQQRAFALHKNTNKEKTGEDEVP